MSSLRGHEQVGDRCSPGSRRGPSIRKRQREAAFQCSPRNRPLAQPPPFARHRVSTAAPSRHRVRHARRLPANMPCLMRPMCGRRVGIGRQPFQAPPAAHRALQCLEWRYTNNEELAMRAFVSLILAAALASVSGCADMTPKQRNTALGAAAGGVAGAAIWGSGRDAGWRRIGWRDRQRRHQVGRHTQYTALVRQYAALVRCGIRARQSAWPFLLTERAHSLLPSRSCARRQGRRIIIALRRRPRAIRATARPRHRQHTDPERRRAVQALRRTDRGRRPELFGAPRTMLRTVGPQRRGQDHHAAHAARHDDARCGHPAAVRRDRARTRAPRAHARGRGPAVR